MKQCAVCSVSVHAACGYFIICIDLVSSDEHSRRVAGSTTNVTGLNQRRVLTDCRRLSCLIIPIVLGPAILPLLLFAVPCLRRAPCHPGWPSNAAVDAKTAHADKAKETGKAGAAHAAGDRAAATQ